MTGKSTGRAMVLAAAAALATAGCGGSADGKQAGHAPGGPGGPPKESVPVEVAPVRQQEMAALYSTSATLRASRRATVTTRTSGVLRRLRVEEGQRVGAGQPLAELEREEQRIAFERSKATVETRRRELERVQSLFEQQLVSEDAFEKARRDYLDAHHATELAELELARTVIEAPFDGVVVQRHLDVGNTVTAGTPVYDLADVTPLHADVHVPERHVARLAPGQRVRLTPDAAPAGVDAVIERIAPAVDPATGTVKVTLAVEQGAHLRPGAFVRVDIVTDTRAEALVVPRAALAAEGRRWFVYRLKPSGEEVEKIEVELGFEAPDRVEVRPAAGQALRPGDRVVVAGTGGLEHGARVEVAASAPGDPSGRAR